MPLCLAFVDYEKAFDSVERTAISNALYEQGINETYIKLIENIYANVTSVVRLHKDTEKINIEKGVRQGDTYQNCSLPVLKGYSESLLANQKGKNIDGKHLTHLRFADDIVLISNNAEHLQEMLNDQNFQSRFKNSQGQNKSYVL